MSILVDGILKSSAGNVIGNADIVLTAISTSLVVLGGTPLSIKTDADGHYSFTLHNGNYAVSVSKEGNNWFSGMIGVTDLTIPKSINALLLQDAMMAEIPADYWSYFQAQAGILFTSFSKIDDAVQSTELAKESTANDAEIASLAKADAAINAGIALTAAQNAAITANIYPTLADAQTAITSGNIPSGRFFFIRSISDNSIADEYQNASGIAVATGRVFPAESYFRDAIAPVRLQNQYPDSGFAAGVVPSSRYSATLTPISNEYLNELGVINGIYSSGRTSTHVLVPIPASWLGRYVIMSCFFYNSELITPVVGTYHQYITTGTNIISDGLVNSVERLSDNILRVVSSGRIPTGSGVTALAIGAGGFGTGGETKLICAPTFALSDAPILLETFEWDVLDSIRAERMNTISADVLSGSERINTLETKTEGLPTSFIRNFETNGAMEMQTAWTYYGSGVFESVSHIHELSDIGIAGGFRVTPPSGGNTASRFDSNAATISVVANAAPGEKLLVGTVVYASDGATFPNLTSSAGFTITQDGILTGANSWGHVQINAKTRFYFAVFNAIAAEITRLTIGFTASNSYFPDSPAVRYHTGIFVHHATDIRLPTESTIQSYLGWDGQGSNAEFFQQLQDLLDASTDAISPVLRLGGDGLAESYVEVFREGRKVRRSFTPFPAESLTTPNVFNFRSDYIDNVQIRQMTDDVAPYRALGTTIGANHGFSMTKITATAHGKTTADIGSIYSNGGMQYVLVGIDTVNAVYLTSRTDNSAVPVGVLTRVSGGVSTANIVGTAATTTQMYPPIKNREISCQIDGVTVTDKTGFFSYRDSVVFSESYEIMDKASIVAWYENYGASGVITPDGDAAIHVSISYAFDRDAHCTIYTDFLTLKDGVPLQDIMFLQAVRGSANDGAVKYYIPKALPFTQFGLNFDFANIGSSSTVGWTDRVNLTPARCEPTGILADRLIQLSDRFGFAMGYLPVGSTSLSVRRTNATVKAMQISNNGTKVYLSAIDNGTRALAAGQYYSTVGYRNLLINSSARTAHYAVRTNGADYLYVDWHAHGIDRVPVPPDYAGRSFEIVEKSDNVAVLSESLTNTIVVNVSDSKSYGYLILRIN
ncbi:hypothetical protein Z042_23200 [Chania multitudinisentens RB-25]|uniref:Lambda-like tail fibre protein N-terminal domain-containing protein n=1 Tax=Chania multitudinisentens RB-25 TaxID=1441930 RepID=W0LKZ4_9GAMM|nr:prophage tail fiber N-terminal domain-containing protein [Chania multitudinisentens]AHG22997.1 hypothetical protein Z042_23200 [Chania multitudinisentens RB-25]